YYARHEHLARKAYDAYYARHEHNARKAHDAYHARNSHSTGKASYASSSWKHLTNSTEYSRVYNPHHADCSIWQPDSHLAFCTNDSSCKARLYPSCTAGYSLHPRYSFCSGK
ncbi:hypothetical protein, partial [Anaerocolumna jejuensis]|uniref:hypothetical protein n=1 Tax=Anaerocolumna jejuensis TaxID=259063 RepID=UPI00147D3808